MAASYLSPALAMEATKISFPLPPQPNNLLLSRNRHPVSPQPIIKSHLAPFPSSYQRLPASFPVALQLASICTILSRTPPAFGAEEMAQSSQVATDTVTETVESGAISFLFFGAAVGLSVLTIGVIYLAVSDLLEKREREKELKLATSDAKNKKSKKPVSSRPGPRGFGKKFEDDD